MNNKSYVVKFYRKAEKQGEKDSYLGMVELDDVGVTNAFSLQAKAFRQASPKCLYANKIRIEHA